MTRVLFLLALEGCAVESAECEPFIEYDDQPTGAPTGCHNLEFYEVPIPDARYPVGTRASVNECKPGEGKRLFECEPDGSWRELFVYKPRG